MVSTIIEFGMIASVIFGAIYLILWFNQRTRTAYFWFAASAFSVTFFAAIELRIMHAPSIEDFIQLRHWGHLGAFFVTASFLLFVKAFLSAGRLWPLGVAIGLRIAVLIMDQFAEVSINFRSISGLKSVTFLGEKLVIAETIPNPWQIVGQASLIFFIIYCADATIQVWRRGNRSTALFVGGSAILFPTLSTLMAVVINWSILEIPLVISPFFIGTIACMGYELTKQVVNTQKLSAELERERAEVLMKQESLNVAAEAGNVGVWVREIDTGKMFASSRWRAIFGFPETQELTFELLCSRINSDDLPHVLKALETANVNSGHYEAQYRIALDDGATRWISSRGKIENSQDGRKILYGASADITALKTAELNANRLTGRIIEAQEGERSRLARELHDDLSQGLALLSMQVDAIAVNSEANAAMEEKLDLLSERIRRISSQVRRISHTLHPELLQQLGLIASVREYFSEIEMARGMKVDFTHSDTEVELPDEIALCFFRITQEALQNAAKHSGTLAAQVDLNISETEIRLSISDNGKGFDPSLGSDGQSLGLLSMKERIRAVDGILMVDSALGEGTRVTATAPIELNGAKARSA